ncbi:hypothetical protein IHE48_22095 [Frankia sp. CH37]|nr:MULTISPECIES: YiaA/YiaB family inner membrane protein [Parafrankia]MBE3203615.1 hypothetical protein [Parafrankia sp. CH37]
MSTDTQAGWGGRADTVLMTTAKAPVPRTTTAFMVQATLSFSISVIAVLYAIAHLPGDAWMRGFLLLGTLYIVTSTFTLSKCVRDHQEASAVISRVDQARLERLMAEYDPFKQQLTP